MIRLQINPAYADLLVENHLSTYRELMETDAGQVIEENDERDVRRLQLNQTGFYLKRVWREKASAALESYLAGRLAHGRTYREKQQYECLQRHGFDVAEIAAVGEELHYAFPANGFILTREVPGKNLLDLFREADEDLRLIIARRFGALVGRLYRHGFFGSVRLKDIICADPPGVDARLTLIDREVRHPP